MFALGSDAGVLVFGVIQQTLNQGLHQAHLQRGSQRVFPHPPQHPLRYQSDVAGLVLKTLGGGNQRSHRNCDSRHLFVKCLCSRGSLTSQPTSHSVGVLVLVYLDKLRDEALVHAEPLSPQMVPHQESHRPDSTGGNGDLEHHGGFIL